MAELRLDVTLNLTGFRTQLEKLAQEAGSRYFGVNLSIDEADFKKQLKELEKIKPVITINDSQLVAAKQRISTLNKSLATLRRATSTPIEIKVKYVEQGKPPTGAISKSGTFRQRLTGLDAEPIKQLYAAAGKAGLLQFDTEIAKSKSKIITALNQAGESSVTGLLNGLKSKDSAVKTAAKSLGDILIAALKLSLQIQSPSKKMEAIGEDAGEGFNKGLKDSLNEAKTSAVNAMRGIVAALRIEAAKIQNISLAPGSLRSASASASLRGGARGGRGYFNSIGPLPEGSKEPYTMTDRGYQPYLGGPGVGPSAPPRGLLPPASAIGRGFSGQSFAGAPINFKMGADIPALPSSEATKRLRQQEQVAQGTAERLRQQARVAQAHLRSAERSATVFGERAARLDKVMSAFRTSGRTTGYTSPIGPLPRNSAEPYAAGSRGMFGQSGFEPRLESRPVAGLLPPSLTPTREQIVAARTQIARQRSDARALDAQVENQFRQTQFKPTVPPRQYFQPNTQPLLPGGGRAVPYGPSTSQGNFRSFSQRATQVQQAASSGGGIPPGGGRAPVGGGGGGVPPGGGGGGGGGAPPRGGGGGGAFAGMQFTMPKLPGRGIVQELGTEFAFAAKQVLLFGAAYKALAFLTDFPSKVGEAVGQLQGFRNTIKAISPTANEAAQSSQFILDVVDKYNVPLQSARDGFTKLYASMEPTGFSGNEIRDLFTGISQAAATFGMSSDKVDRVTYAFAQMASKGQVMSEELKGQLGDVLPGAMGIFAKAAGFEGADAIQKFGKALEDGAYKGKPMRDLLKNVTIELKKEFGPGAEGAAKTYQGVMTRMANSTKLFYETFEPVAVGFLNAVVMPITAGIKQLTDGFNAFFTGQVAQTRGGNALAQQLNDLKPSFDGILANLKSLIPSFQIFGNLLLQVAKFLTTVAGNPIVGFLLKVYANIFLVNTAFTLLGGQILVGLIVNINAAIFRLIAFGYAINAVGIQTTGANTALAGTRSQLLLLQSSAAGATAPLNALMGSLLKIAAIAAAAIVITVIVNGLTEMKDAEARLARLREERDPVGPSGPRLISTAARRYAGASREKILSDQQKQIDLLAKYRLDLAKMEKDDQDNRAAASTGFGGKVVKNTSAANIDALKIRIKDAEDVVNLNSKQFKTQKDIESAAERIAKIKLEGGDNDKKRKAEEERQAKLQDKLANREQQLAVDNANRQVALDQSSFDSRLRMSDAEYDHLRALQDSHFEREISGLDSIEARQKKFQQDLKAIENRRIDSIRKAELDSVKAVQDLRSATTKAIAVTGGAPGDSSKYVDRSVLRKYLESQGFSRTSGDFTNKGHKTPDHMRNAMDYGIMGGSDADALRKTIAMERKLKATGAFGNQFFGPESDPYGHGAGKGGRNIHNHIPTPNEKIKLTPGLAALIGGESLQSSAVGLNTRSGAFAMGRRGDKAEGNLAVEQQEAQIKALEKLETIRRANNLALEQTITLVKQNIDSIFPVKEQKLENDLLEMRNNLELKGTSKEIIDMEVQKYKAVKENAYNLQKLNEEIAKNNEELTKLKGKKITTPDDEEQIKFLTNETAAYNAAIASIPEQQRLFNEQLERTAALAVESPMVKLAKQVNEAKRELMEMSSASSMAIGGAKSIGEAFGNSFKDMITGSKTVKESFASLFQSVGDYFLDMAGRIISKYIEMQAIQGLMSIFSMFAPGAVPGAAPGAAPVPSNLQSGADFGLPGVISTGMVTAANGAVWQGGFTAFASGGIVTGPTLGLVGEGRYNEAIIPLPDGKSVPVELGGAAAGAATNNVTSNIVVNVSSDGQSTSNANGSNSVDLGRKIEGAVKQVIVAELRPGGVLAGRR